MGTAKSPRLRPRRTIGTIAVAVLALVLSACGSDADDSQAQQGTSNSASNSTSSSGQQSPSSEGNQSQQAPQVSKAATQWMNEYCGGMAKVTNAASDIPQTNPQKPKELKNAMSQLLGNIIQGDKEFLADLKDMESSPIAGGDEFVSTAKDSYQELYDTVKNAKSELDSSSASGKKEAAKQVKSAQQAIQQVDLQAPLKKLQSNKKLVGAFEQAPKCRQMVQSAQQQQPQQQQPQPGGGAGPPQPGN